MTGDIQQARSSLERIIPLTIRMEEVQAQALKKLQQMGRTMKMHGFRPGKVPLKVIQQTYGAQAHSEAIGDVVSRAYSEAIVAQSLRPAGSPDIRPKQTETISADANVELLEFEAVIEIYPEVSVPDRSALSLVRWNCEVQESDVDKTIETLRKQRTEYSPVDRPAQADDQARVDFAGSIDGVPFEGGSAKDFSFIVSAGQMLPEFDAAVVGMRAGETKVFPLTFPTDYRAKELAGRTGEFKVTLHEVQQPALPELNDAFAKSFGIEEGGLGRLREDVARNLRREVEDRCKGKTKQAALDALSGVAQFDVPKALVESESERMADQMRQDMTERGMNVKDAPIPAALFAEQAGKRVRLGLLVGEIVRSQGLAATEAQVRAFVASISESYEKPDEFVRWTLSDRGRRAEAEAVVTEQNVVQWVLEGARVEDKTLTVDELMKEPAQS